MFLPMDPSSIPPSSSSSVPTRKRSILQSCEDGSKQRKLNDDAVEEIQIESNMMTHAQEPQAGLVPQTAKTTPEEESRRVSAKGELNKLCSMRHWKPPVYEWEDEGPCHRPLYVGKATIEIKEDSKTTVLECFGNPQHKKKLAAEEAAEAALWYLKNVGHTLQTDKASASKTGKAASAITDNEKVDG